MQRKTILSRYKVTFGRGSAPYLATLPTILSEEEEISHNLNNNRSGAVNRNQMNSASSDTMALSAEEVEEVVRLVEEGEVEAHHQLRNGGSVGLPTARGPTRNSMEPKLEYRLSQLPGAPETQLL